MLSEAKHLDLLSLGNRSKSDQRFFASLRMTFAKWVESCLRVIRVSRE
jgi:hypothetical protein